MTDSLRNYRDKHDDFNKGKAMVFSHTDPIEGFHAWFNEAVSQGEKEANAVVLSTSNREGRSSSRVVYLKELQEGRFVFYTNFSSKKGKDIEENPWASMLFFWPGMERQLRIEGKVTKISDADSDAYFSTRPRDSQLGAWASHQSDVLDEPQELWARFDELSLKYPELIPRPSHWGGMQLIPELFEFWTGKASRLHERVVFEKNNEQWVSYRKNP